MSPQLNPENPPETLIPQPEEQNMPAVVPEEQKQEPYTYPQLPPSKIQEGVDPKVANKRVYVPQDEG